MFSNTTYKNVDMKATEYISLTCKPFRIPYNNRINKYAPMKFKTSQVK